MWAGLLQIHPSRNLNCTMADRELDEDEKAERAREFRTNINRKRPSRKRYSIGYLPSQRSGGGKFTNLPCAAVISEQTMIGKYVYTHLY